MNVTRIAVVAMVAVMGLLTVQATAGWTEHKLTAFDAAGSDYFGYSASINGDYAIVGAYGDDDGAYGAGSAYIYKRNVTTGDWLGAGKLTASTPIYNGYFGCSVSINGDYAIVGSYRDDYYTGSAYIFKRDGASWTQQAKLTASDGAFYDYFGASVSISGDYALIGAYSDNDDTGAAYIFKRNGTSWTEQKLTASDATTWSHFGYSVSIDGDYAVIGAKNDGGADGAAYVFKCDGTSWSEQIKLRASDKSSGDNFGYSVSIDGSYVVVGATGNDDTDSDSGSAYVFKRDGTSWTEQDKLTASDAARWDAFGHSVSISGDCAVIGSDNSESVYTFTRDGEDWTQQSILTASDAAASDEFGCSVSIDDGSVLVGAWGNDDDGGSSGSAYVLVPEPASASLLLLGAVAIFRRRRNIKHQ